VIQDSYVHFGRRVGLHVWEAWCGAGARAAMLTVPANWNRLDPKRRCAVCDQKFREFEKSARFWTDEGE
jgi:hypothetical protein